MKQFCNVAAVKRETVRTNPAANCIVLLHLPRRLAHLDTQWNGLHENLNTYSEENAENLWSNSHFTVYVTYMKIPYIWCCKVINVHKDCADIILHGRLITLPYISFYVYDTQKCMVTAAAETTGTTTTIAEDQNHIHPANINKWFTISSFTEHLTVIWRIWPMDLQTCITSLFCDHLSLRKANRRELISHAISSTCIWQMTRRSASIISAFNSGFVPVLGFHICMSAHYNYRMLPILQA
jgi:hypothetical protein